MLIEFSVGNYRSFKDTVTFSMVAANLTAKNKELDQTNVFPLTDSISLLKSCAIYGANTSGKSNLIHAIEFVKDFVRGSATGSQVGDAIQVNSFKLSSETDDKPSFFEIVFYLEDKRYRYGFTTDRNKIYSEWLFHAKDREKNLFTREDDKFTLSSVFKEGKGLQDKTRNNALFLSVVSQFNGPISRAIVRWFSEMFIGSRILTHIQRKFLEITAGIVEEKGAKDFVLWLLRNMDIGIDDFEIKRRDFSMADILSGEIANDTNFKRYIPDLGIQVLTRHKRYSKDESDTSFIHFDLDTEESEGTQKIFALAGLLLGVLQLGTTLFIDELDARLHPLLTESIVRLFNSNETNPNNAQLVFTTHDTNLLTNKLFRRDQIWFTEKDKYGATDLYSLAEYKVRSDASYEKDYIAGKYGAIPFIGGMNRLVEADG